MPPKKYFSYIRVSTQRQGQAGTSLAEQQTAIEHFARNWSLPIVTRFEERETAAKQGRPVFLEMLKQLKQRKADGVIIHKIDRSARNLKDWAALGSLIDNGVEVHFASESLDLNSRGGRLSADIQAVVASDYIRNLREETKKGIYGRLKQGYYPFPAVVGYLDSGQAKPKRIDPVMGPLVRMAFELYATGDHSLESLSNLMFDRGLRSKRGNKVGNNSISMMLRNPFYVGVIKIKKRGETYAGVHNPLINKKLFDDVQRVLAGRNLKKSRVHFFVYRRMIRCGECSNYLVAERQKGHVYYRCHTDRCSTPCLKEETVGACYEAKLRMVQLSPNERSLLLEIVTGEIKQNSVLLEQQKEGFEIQLKQIKDRINRLADGYMDGVFDREAYGEKKELLLIEQQDLITKLSAVDNSYLDLQSKFDQFLELANSAYLSFRSAEGGLKRDLVDSLTSNLLADGKSVSIKLKTSFEIMATRPTILSGAPQRVARRTLSAWVRQLLKSFDDFQLRDQDTDLGIEP